MIIWCIDVVGTVLVAAILICFAIYGALILLGDLSDRYDQWSFNRKLRKIEKKRRKIK